MHFATSNKVHDTFDKVPGLLVIIFSVIRRCLTKVRFKYCGEVSLITEPDTICYLADVNFLLFDKTRSLFHSNVANEFTSRNRF